MHNIIFRLIILIVFVMCASSVQAQETVKRQPSIELPAELERVLRDYEKAWGAGDANALAVLFTKKGYVPTGQGWVQGAEAIKNKYQGVGGDLQLRAIDYAMEGEVGFIVGAYGYGDDAATLDRGSFVLALRKSVKGKWLIVADLDKSNRR